jgi:hypothetical protein
VDGELFLSDEAKFDCRRDILSQVTDELTDAGLSTDAVHITFHLTSIYDHSIFDVMSRVVQRLIVNYATMEDLLNMLVSTCSMEKAFLFDVVSKLYISTDAGPVDMQSVELCSDMIDVVMDVSGIYSVRTDADNHHGNNKDKQPPGGGDSSFVQDDVIDAFDEDSASVIHLSSGLVRRWLSSANSSLLIPEANGLTLPRPVSGVVFEGSRHQTGSHLHHTGRKLSQKEFDQLQHRLLEESSSRARQCAH